MPKYGYREIADLGSRCSSGCWIRARFQARLPLHVPCSAASIPQIFGHTPSLSPLGAPAVVEGPMGGLFDEPM